MPKVVSIRERVHQPFYDSLVRTAGLTPGQRYVTAGAFELKTKIVTSGLGAHAGHGH